MARKLVSLLALTGCSSVHSLSEVPIEGGTPEQRALVEDELAAFDRWVGSGRIVLRAVRFNTLRSTLGRYQGDRRRVELDVGIEPSDVRWVVRHELCHALDFQEDLLADPVPVLDALVERFEGAGLVDAARSKRVRRSEVLAELCNPGPTAVMLLQTPCSSDPDELAPASAFLADHVWSGEVDLLPSGRDPVGVSAASFEGSFAPDDILMLGGADGETAHLALVGSEEGSVSVDIEDLWIDLVTGEPVEAAPPAYDTSGSYDLEPDVPLPVGLAATPASATTLPVHTVVQGERALVVVDVPLDARVRRLFGPIASRAVLLDGERWHAVDACPGDVATVFSTPDQLWLAWAEDQVVRWAPVDPP